MKSSGYFLRVILLLRWGLAAVVNGALPPPAFGSFLPFHHDDVVAKLGLDGGVCVNGFVHGAVG